MPQHTSEDRRRFPVVLPPLGDDAQAAVFLRWRKEIGDAVTEGEALYEIDADRFTAEIPSARAGVLASQSAKPGDGLAVGQIIGHLDVVRQARQQGRGLDRTQARRQPAHLRRPGAIIHCLGTLMIVYTLLSVFDPQWREDGTPTTAVVVVMLLWLWHGWGIYHWTWTLSAAEIPRLNAVAASQDADATYHTLLIRNWLGWVGAMVAGRLVLTGAGWLPAIGAYLLLPGLLARALGFAGAAIGMAWIGSRKFSAIATARRRS